MYIGTRCSDVATVGVDAVTIAGVVTRAGTMGAVRTADVVIGADGFGGATRAAVGDETLGVVEVMESVGSCDVGAAAGSAGDRFEPALAEPLAPAQPATTIERTAAPARERAAYHRACLITTHASE